MAIELLGFLDSEKCRIYRERLMDLQFRVFFQHIVGI